MFLFKDECLEDMDISPNANNKIENEELIRHKEMDMDISPFNASASPHSTHSNNKKHRPISTSPSVNDNRSKQGNHIDYCGKSNLDFSLINPYVL